MKNYLLKFRWIAAIFVLLFCADKMLATENLLINGTSAGVCKNNAPWTTSYGTSTGSATTSAGTTIGLSWTRVGRMNSGIQIEAGTSKEFHSTSYPTGTIITAIRIVDKTNTSYLYGSANGTDWTSISYTSGTAVNVSSYSYKYFKVTATSKYVVLSSINVTYSDDNSCGKFYESFYAMNSTGGNDDKWSGSISGTSYSASSHFPDNSGWSFTQGYVANECMRLGTTGNAGSATTPAIPVTSGKKYTLKFTAGAWGSEACTLTVTATGASITTAVSPSGALSTSEFTEYTATLTASSSSMTITFTGTNKKRYFLDEVCVEDAPSCADPTALTKGSFS